MKQRTIMFRAWDTIEKKMCTEALMIGNIGLGEGSVAVTEEVQINHPLIWMQFTGLIDKNEKPIYEGDILRQSVDGHTVIAPMIWNQRYAQFGLDAELDFDSPEHVELNIPEQGVPEIIGNIYENPELLK